MKTSKTVKALSDVQVAANLRKAAQNAPAYAAEQYNIIAEALDPSKLDRDAFAAALNALMG